MNKGTAPHSGRVLLGPAGWSYPDWKGVIYPRPTPKGFDPLAHVAGFLDLVEINRTFYRPVAGPVAEDWCRRVSGRPDFQFVVKAWQGFTHHGAPPSAAEGECFGAGLRPLADAGRLAAVLAQFPHRFHCGRDRIGGRIRHLQRWVPQGVPIAVEVRHRSWNDAEYLRWLEDAGLVFVNIDQPRLPGTLGPTAWRTHPRLAYVRLHGRNTEAWFNPDAGRDERYDYAYSSAELGPWAEAIDTLSRGAPEGKTLVVGNNHFQGQAVATVLELGRLLGEERRPVPDCVARAFPDANSDTHPGRQ